MGASISVTSTSCYETYNTVYSEVKVIKKVMVTGKVNSLSLTWHVGHEYIIN